MNRVICVIAYLLLAPLIGGLMDSFDRILLCDSSGEHAKPKERERADAEAEGTVGMAAFL